MPPEVGGWSLNHWTSREVPGSASKIEIDAEPYRHCMSRPLALLAWFHSLAPSCSFLGLIIIFWSHCRAFQDLSSSTKDRTLAPLCVGCTEL